MRAERRPTIKFTRATSRQFARPGGAIERHVRADAGGIEQIAAAGGEGGFDAWRLSSWSVLGGIMNG